LSLQGRIRALRDDERGFAIVIAAALIVLIAIVSVSLTLLVQGEDSHARRDQAKDGAFQAAEAGTNAYLSDLTESNIFWSAYMAKGEATRTDGNGVTHASSTTVDKPWTWGSTWTYTTPRSTDTGWLDVGNGYQYLIQVYPPNGSLAGLAQVITRIDVTGRPTGSIDVSKWKTLETMIRPSSLTDFQAFLATSISYGSTATTTGQIFVGEDNNHNVASLNHDGTAKANLYAEGSVTGSTTYQNGAKKYDKNTSPTALCKLNNCTPVPFTSFASTITTVSGAANSGGISLAATDNTNPGLSGQGYSVDAWKLVFLSNGTVQISSCKKYKSGGTTYEVYDGSNQPVCGTATTKNVPSNGAIYSAVDVIVSGAVHGKVTVATSGDVVYGGNTTYVTAGADVFGVEAEGSIYVAQWAPDASHNLTIYSAQLALNGPFEADPSYNGGAHGTLNFYGSSAIYGQANGAIIFSNLFSTRNYNYDNNLLFLPPPYWPTLGNAFTILVQRPV
jgi:hypothetical protein